jgi:hypothetical protein
MYISGSIVRKDASGVGPISIPHYIRNPENGMLRSS